MIAHSEIQGSPQERFTANGLQATRQLMCAWASRHALVVDLLRNGGQDYPHWSGMNMRAREVSSVEPYPHDIKISAGATTQVASYAQALLTVVYATPETGQNEKEVDPVTGELYSESIEPITEFLTLPVLDENNAPIFTWADTKEITENQATLQKLVKSFDYVVTFYARKYLNPQVLNLVGCVNLYKVRSKMLGWTFPPETLLLGCPPFTRTTTLEGTGAWDQTYRFSYRQYGWNHFFRPATNQWERVKKGADIQYFYERKDLSGL